MKKMLIPSLLAVSACCCLCARADTEWGSTGDLRSFRYKGEPIELTTSIRMSSPDGAQTGQAQLQTTGRTGTRLVLTGNLGFGSSANTAGKGKGAGKGGPGKGGGAGPGGVGLRVQVDDTATDTTTFDVQASAGTSIPLDGIYYWFNLAGANFAAGTAELVPADNAAAQQGLARRPAGGRHALCRCHSQIHPHHRHGQPRRRILLCHAHSYRPPGNPRRRARTGAAAAERRAARTTYNLLIPIGTGTLNPGAPFHRRLYPQGDLRPRRHARQAGR